MFCRNVSRIIISYLDLIEIHSMGICGNKIAKNVADTILSNRFLIYDYLFTKQIEDTIYDTCKNVMSWKPTNLDIQNIERDLYSFVITDEYNINIVHHFLSYPYVLRQLSEGVVPIAYDRNMKYFGIRMSIIMHISGKKIQDMVNIDTLKPIFENDYSGNVDRFTILEAQFKLHGNTPENDKLCRTLGYNPITIWFHLDDSSHGIKFEDRLMLIPRNNPLCEAKLNILKTYKSWRLLNSMIVDSDWDINEPNLPKCIEYVFKKFPQVVNKQLFAILYGVISVGRIDLVKKLIKKYGLSKIRDELSRMYMLVTYVRDYSAIIYVYKKYGLKFGEFQYYYTSNDHTANVCKGMINFLEVFEDIIPKEEYSGLLKIAINTNQFDAIKFMVSRHEPSREEVEKTLNKYEKKYINL